MSLEQAERFLVAVAQNQDLRTHFIEVKTPEEFAQVAKSLGYDFTPNDLKIAVENHSKGVTQRRHTGVWEWLRRVPWIDRSTP